MDEPVLVVVTLTMFVGSYLAGFIPLFFTLNEGRIRVASIFGAGLLVGTAFCVIIPEGISSLVESSSPPSLSPVANSQPTADLGRINALHKTLEDVSKNVLPKRNQDVQRRGVRSWDDKQSAELFDQSLVDGDAKGGRNRRSDPSKEENRQNAKSEENEKGNSESEKGHHEDSQVAQPNGSIGVSLLVGFLFMHVIDQLSKLSHSRHKGVPTLGLVIHAFADGIAMGSASSTGSRVELQILVFAAIMLHKAPTSFALVSILLASGLDKARVRRHLLIFSLAAPIGTVLTYAFLHTAQPTVPAGTLNGGSSSAEASSQYTGLILLFSAGTFLYIATVHVLPELIESKCSSALGGGAGMSGSREMLLGCGEKPTSGGHSRFSLAELCLFCASAMIPAFISSATHGKHGH